MACGRLIFSEWSALYTCIEYQKEKMMMTVTELHAERQRIEAVLPVWIESLALPGPPFGRFKLHQAQEEPWLLYASQQMLSLAIDSGYWANLAATRQSEWLDVLLSCQDPASGLFICPIASADNAVDPAQWDQVSYSRSITVKLLKRLKQIGVEPRHLPPQAEKVCPTLADLPRSLAELPWDTRPYGAGSQAGFWGTVRLQELAAAKQNLHHDPYVNTIVRFLESRQNPQTGFWGNCPDRESGMNGLLKSINIYRLLARPLPHTETIVESILAIQQEDGSFGKGTCSSSNAMVILGHIAGKVPAQKERLRDAALRVGAAQAASRQPDGLYSANPAGCLTALAYTRLCRQPQKISDVLGTGHTRGILELAENLIALSDAPERKRAALKQGLAPNGADLKTESDGMADFQNGKEAE
jgi:hypothetical protein